MTILGPILAKTPVVSIDDVLGRLGDIEAALPREDGVACFNKLYVAVTQNVRDSDETASAAEARFLSTLDVTFANLYFAALSALEAGEGPPRAWAPLFAARARTDITPLQFALAGMNAHINRDLPIGLVQSFSSLGVEMARPSPEAADYDGVNDVLARTEASVAADYFTPLLKELHRDAHGADDRVANWSIREARAAAWTNGSVLWHLRGSAALADAYVDSLDGMVGFAGRGLLSPV